jgi:hypothetical protein
VGGAMMARDLFSIICLGAIGLLNSGCGGSPEGGNVKLAAAGGTVKYNGAPVAQASVTFIPETGPIANATTDMSGKFTLMTGSMSGVALGPCKVTVTYYQAGAKPGTTQNAVAPTGKPSNPEEFRRQMVEGTAEKMRAQSESPDSSSAPKSVIPEIYGKPETTTLTFTVDSDTSKNQFPIDLKD